MNALVSTIDIRPHRSTSAHLNANNSLRGRSSISSSLLDMKVHHCSGKRNGFRFIVNKPVEHIIFQLRIETVRTLHSDEFNCSVP